MRPSAYDDIWLVGDDFVSDTVGEFFQSEDETKPYMRDRYDVKVFCSTSLDTEHSVLARLHNNFVNAVNEEGKFPKAIVFVIDGDLIKSVCYKRQGLSEIYGQLMKNLMYGVHREILAFKEQLPLHSKRNHYPSVLWALAPYHCNFPGNWNANRKRFNQVVEKLVPLHEEMHVLRLIKVWDPNKQAFFKDHRFTANGLSSYWALMDSAFRHWDTFTYPKIWKKTQQPLERKIKTTLMQSDAFGRKKNDFISNEFNRYKKFKQTDKFRWEKHRSMPQLPNMY